MDRIGAADEKFLKTTLRLAKRGQGRTFPNPMVGAVVVQNGRVVGEGYHRKAGGPHAEIEALRVAGAQAKGATLYVNLEPCSHWGRTPPCADAIIRAKVKKVVCCTRDTHPVARGGIEKLRGAHITVSVGLLQKEARDLNEAFFTFHEKHRPFVAIKFAASLDGKIATHTGDSKWITNERARAYARALRGNYQAIMVGINTVLHDDPHLGLRTKGQPDPLRVILDSTLRVSLKSKVLRDANVLIFTTKRSSKTKYKKLVGAGIQVVACAGNSISVGAVLKELTRREIVSVFVEGGASVLGSFVDAKCVDKVYVFQAPIIIGGGEAKSAVGGKGASSIRKALHLTRVKRKTFGDDMLVSGYVAKGRQGSRNSCRSENPATIEVWSRKTAVNQVRN